MPVDNLWTTRRTPVQVIHNSRIHLTCSIRFMLSREPVCRCSSQRVVNLMPVLCLLLGSIAIQMQPAQASTNSVDHYKLYAHSRIVNEEQYKCLSKIIYKESRWNVNAKNGSHFGLGQMRSKWYRNLDGYRQIDASIKYINGRYGSMCNAWRFHERVGHY
jgi:hypothetical protein